MQDHIEKLEWMEVGRGKKKEMEIRKKVRCEMEEEDHQRIHDIGVITTIHLHKSNPGVLYFIQLWPSPKACRQTQHESTVTGIPLADSLISFTLA